MGDYTLCHLHFLTKEETPKDVIEIISRRVESGFQPPDTDPTLLSEFHPCNSAYHHVKSFLEKETMYSEFYGHYEGLRINTMFQAKYGRGIDEFIRYISPWVVINKHNKGCVGWTLSEYCSYPTWHFVKPTEEDPKDQYIRDLESQLAQFMTKSKT